MSRTIRDEKLKRLASLKSERATHEPVWRELEENYLPEATRWLPNERSEGQRRNTNILKGSAVRGHHILSAGMASSITNQATEWFAGTLKNKALLDRDDVRAYLHDVAEAIRDLLNGSNFYAEAPDMYRDASGFKTAVMFADQDPVNLLRCEILPLGSYYLQSDHTGQATTLYRVREITVENLVERFGYDACSHSVQEAHDQGHFDNGVEVLHAIEPRKNRDPNSKLNTHMPYSSVWLEIGGAEDKILLESGYEELPFFAWRWKKKEQDPYGSECPALEALGATKQLYLAVKRQAQLVDKASAPPLGVPGGLRGKHVSLLPGAINHLDALGVGQKVEPLIKIDPQAIAAVENMIASTKEDVFESFFVNIFLAMLGEERSNVTATEVQAKKEEKMFQMGIILEGIHIDWLKPFIDLCFGRLQRAGQLPDPPADLVDEDMDFEFESILAKAQRLLGTVAIEKAVQMVGAMAQLWPEIAMKVNAEELFEGYAQRIGLDPDMVHDSEEYQAAIDEATKAAEAQQQAELQAQEAATLKDLSATDLDANSALRAALPPAAGGTAGA